MYSFACLPVATKSDGTKQNYALRESHRSTRYAPVVGNDRRRKHGLRHLYGWQWALFLQVSPGKHTFVVSSLGYQTIKTSLDLHHDKTLDFKLEESSVSISPVEVYGKTQSQQVRESALSVNALDVKPVINSLNSLNELVNRTSGVKIREEGGVGSDFDLSINGLSGNSVRIS